MQSWEAVVAYEACVRLCLAAEARGSVESHQFLHDGCHLLRSCFGFASAARSFTSFTSIRLQDLLLQPGQRSLPSQAAQAESAARSRRSNGVLKIQVRKVKLLGKLGPTATKEPAAAAAGPSLTPHRTGSRTPGYRGVMRQVSGLFRDRLAGLRAPSVAEPSSEGVYCIVRLRSTPPDEVLRVWPGTGDTYTLCPKNSGDDIIMDVFGSPGLLGRALISLSSCGNDHAADKQRIVPFFPEGEVEPAGKAQLLVSYAPSGAEGRSKWGPVGETLAYDVVLAVALSVQGFDGRNLLLQMPWSWLLSEFALTYQVSENYRSLRSAPEEEPFIGQHQQCSILACDHFSAPQEGPSMHVMLTCSNLQLEVHPEFQGKVHCVLQLCQHPTTAALTTINGGPIWLPYRSYLMHIMEVATPTEECLALVYNQLCLVERARAEDSLTRQETRILADVVEQVNLLLATTFESYKSLDEASPSGIAPVFQPATETAAPALAPAVEIFTLLNDVLSPAVQATFRAFFQRASRARCQRHLAATDELVGAASAAGDIVEPGVQVAAYERMRAALLQILNEIKTDLAIDSQNIFPSFLELPKTTAEIYESEAKARLRSFLRACPPSSPSLPVTKLLHATANFQADVASWGIRSSGGGLDARELFGLYIEVWIQDRRLQLLELCKSDTVRWSAASSGHAASPFVETIYGQIKETVAAYDTIMGRWPEYAIVLESAICDVERGVVVALERHYAEALLPLRDMMGARKAHLQYMHKLTRRHTFGRYEVPRQLGEMLNSIKRVLESLRPKIEAQMRAWVAALPTEGATGKAAFGQRFNEVTVELRAKYKNLMQAIVFKLVESARTNRATYLKKVLLDAQAQGQQGDDNIEERMKPLMLFLAEAMVQLDTVLSARIFSTICRGLWDAMARDVLGFLDNRKENMSWSKSTSAAVVLQMLDNLFSGHMQRLQGHALHEKDLEPPRAVVEARLMLSRDGPNTSDDSYTLFN
eukprot:SM000045S16273  [mRNA]  locus=s45:674261:679828:+ [translate_table: standard]